MEIIMKKCIVCGSEILGDGEKYCSRACTHKGIKGNGNPMFKNAKLVGTCKVCSKDFEYYKSVSSGIYCSAACSNSCHDRVSKMKQSKIKSIDGVPERIIKQRIRAGAEYKKWCRCIYERDNFKCVLCGSKNKIQAHHIIAFSAIFEEVKISGFKNMEQLFDTSNGITLCEDCHKKTDTYRTGIKNIPEKRLLIAIRRNFEKSNDGYKTFFDYYNSKMETLIDHFKGKLD